ncbi:MAG TPA: hypothetical protein PK402_02715 [Tepidisphaeraceae bacterium]|nr:hypothetical protein [Tepidisphaeraceae bacterium]
MFGELNPAQIEQHSRLNFVAPISNPFYSDDAIVRTDVRFIYNSTRFDDNSAIGGNADLYTLQPHLAITPQVEVSLNKLGYIAYYGDESAPGAFDDGMNDLAVTVKYAFYQNYERQLFMAVGAGYEFAFGDDQAMQDDDEWRIFFAINKGQGALHFGGTVNLLFTDGDDNGITLDDGNSATNDDYAFGDSKVSLIWDLHMDYYLSRYFSPVFQISGYHGLDREPDNEDTIGGLGFTDQNGDFIKPMNISMADMANMATGGDIYVASFGGEFRPLPTKLPNLSLRGAFEVPFRFGNSMDTQLEYRMTFGVSYKF